jgi:hypothetical protein
VREWCTARFAKKEHYFHCRRLSDINGGKSMKASLLLFLAATMLLAACAPASPAAPPPTDTVGKGNLPEYVISMEVSGGIAGITEEYTLFPDGRIVSSQGKEARVSAQQLAGVYASLDEHRFFEMEEDYTLFSNCRDCFTYIVTVQDGDRFKTVKAEEGTTNAPQGLWVIVREISKLAAGVK